MHSFIDEYKYENLPEDLQTVSEIIGMEATKKLIKSFGGSSIYFPTSTNMKFMVDYIKENYDGKNRLKIQRFLNIGVTCFYQALKRSFEV